MNALSIEEARLAASRADAAYYDSYIEDTRRADKWSIRPIPMSAETAAAGFIATGLWLHYHRLKEEETGAQAKRLQMQVRRVRRRLYRRIAS